MFEVSVEDILERFRLDNPWWDSGKIDDVVDSWPRRHYFDGFSHLVTETGVRRAVVLMGPRRVGKTVMIRHAISKLLSDGVSPQNIFYISLDTPLYNGLLLEKIYRLYTDNFSKTGQKYVFLDEVPYIRDWEIQLKSLIDTFKKVKFTVSGSAAAALKKKSDESGAGRFTDYLLPPLTFAEFLIFSGRKAQLIIDVEKGDDEEKPSFADTLSIKELNKAFNDYISYGGYPEAVMSDDVRRNNHRYVKNDIIEKVLLGDLPTLFGISDIQELKSLFVMLAYNTGGELSLEQLSQKANISKNTIKRYLEYLEAAFLIRRVERIDNNARKFQRATTFKIYITNTTLWSALFGAPNPDSENYGRLVETAIMTQWFHNVNEDSIYYARWPNGEIDVVYLEPASQKPEWLVEVKWTDRFFERPSELKALLQFAREHEDILDKPLVTTREARGTRRAGGLDIDFVPAAVYAYSVGKNLVDTQIRDLIAPEFDFE